MVLSHQRVIHFDKSGQFHSKSYLKSTSLKINSTFYNGKRALTNLQMRQDALINSSRRFYQNINRFFKKLLMFLKMLCQVFRYLFFLLVILNSIGLHYLCTTKRNIHSLHKTKRWKTSTLP